MRRCVQSYFGRQRSGERIRGPAEHVPSRRTSIDRHGQRLGLLSLKNPTETLARPSVRYLDSSFPALCELLKPHLEAIPDILVDEEVLRERYGVKTENCQRSYLRLQPALSQKDYYDNLEGLSSVSAYMCTFMTKRNQVQYVLSITSCLEMQHHYLDGPDSVNIIIDSSDVEAEETEKESR